MLSYLYAAEDISAKYQFLVELLFRNLKLLFGGLTVQLVTSNLNLVSTRTCACRKELSGWRSISLQHHGGE